MYGVMELYYMKYGVWDVNHMNGLVLQKYVCKATYIVVHPPILKVGLFLKSDFMLFLTGYFTN